MKVCITVSSLLKNDAIGNDVCHQCKVLNARGIPTVIHAEEVAHDAMAPHVIDRDALVRLLQAPDNLLIYHQGGSWRLGREILDMARCRIFIKYHNVTPPEFYGPYDKRAEAFCRQGLAETREIARLPGVTRFLCASSFNAGDLRRFHADEDKLEISPPFHRLDDFAAAATDAELAADLDDGKLNVLFVGRLVPNKGHKHLIRVMATYAAMYDRNIRLNIVGGIDPGLTAYLNELKGLIARNRLQDIVHIRGAVSFDQLHTYYGSSHIFLLMSEHEGFCLPVLEAQYHGLPVVALDAAAVAGTLGPDQIVFDRPDYKRFAAAIRVIGTNGSYRAHLAAMGRRNMARFANERIEKDFLNSLSIR